MFAAMANTVVDGDGRPTCPILSRNSVKYVAGLLDSRSLN